MLIWEIVPPEKNSSPKDLKLFCDQLVDIVKNNKIDALDIPDLINEEKTDRKRPFKKISSLKLAQLIQQKIKIPIIVNHVTVFDQLTKQKQWLIDVYKNYQINKIILVGAPDNKSYPGLSVVQMAKLVSQLNKEKLINITCGGITIPTRQILNKEAERIVAKQKAGVKFFFSQIIYESKNTCRVLKNYYQFCQKEQLTPAKIIVTFSPLSSLAGLKFLTSLRVYIPATIKKLFLANPNQIDKLSIEVIKQVWQEILTFKKEKKINVPLDVGISYIQKANLQTSKNLLKYFANGSN